MSTIRQRQKKWEKRLAAFAAIALRISRERFAERRAFHAIDRAPTPTWTVFVRRDV